MHVDIISRTTIYRWLKETEIAEKYSSANNKEIKRLLRRVERLEEIIQIINEANCLPSAPLKERLYALEKIYGTHSVHVLCEALNVDRGTFYNHIFRNKKTNTMYAQQREVLRVAIQKVYDENRQIFGAGKITAILKEQGYVTSEDTVRRLMADMGLTSIRQRAKALYEKERKAYCKNRVNQNFTAIAPNQIWVSDVTCYSFQERNYCNQTIHNEIHHLSLLNPIQVPFREYISRQPRLKHQDKDLETEQLKFIFQGLF